MALIADATIDRLTTPGEKVSLTGCVGSSKALLLTDLFNRLKRPLVLIVSDLKEASNWTSDLSFFFPTKANVHLFPPLDILPYYNLSPHPDILMERLGLLWKFTSEKEPFITVVPLHALTRRLIPRKIFLDHVLTLIQGETFEREKLIEKLVDLAYQHVPLVEDKGTFAVRGGICDIFSPAHAHPVRLEFLGDTIESMRFFDPVSQKSLEVAGQVTLVAAREILHQALNQKWKSHLKRICDQNEIPKPERDRIQEALKNRFYFNGVETFLPFLYQSSGTLFDYLPDKSLICTVEGEDLISQWNNELEEHGEHQKKSTSLERVFAPKDIFLEEKEIKEYFSFFPQLDFFELLKQNNFGAVSLAEEVASSPTPSKQGSATSGTKETTPKFHPGDKEKKDQFTMESNTLFQKKMEGTRSSEHALQPLADLLNERRLSGHHLVLVASSPAQKMRLQDLLSRYNLPLFTPEEAQEKKEVIEKILNDGEASSLIQIMLGPITEGFFWPQKKQWWITDEEIFGKKARKLSKKAAGEPLLSFSELKPGDYVVHNDHGIGAYRELVSLTINEIQNDFLLLEYLGGDKLYVPVDKLNLVSRYSSKESSPPMLDKMGGTSWRRAKEKVKKATRRLARELLEIQAFRQAQKGFAYSPSDEMFEEFEATFPYDETEDQLRTIGDVIGDMESIRPMDRLVCGDVGYGKTEVAIRAAFKAVADNKQAAILVPTTILALQHFETFRKRFKDYPVNIKLLSRFQTASEQKKIIQGLKEGKVDIAIATHRLLSRDVHFKNLGLLVVDEEHRFGVKQKEKIKKLRKLVDILTLSATPIPRTLNFALVGIRDLSIINTPPADRLSIRTYVTHFDHGTIREAILREVKRGGQIYFVHNRIQTIDSIKKRLQKIVPEVKIEVAHGQMEENALEEVMIRFMEGKFEVLLCTAIIESGLDIPRANTIIINRADHFGLAQLYQLRGRVGRSIHRAYAYLIIPHETLITDVAKRRLQVIQRFTELGSGFKIAEYDLEIRGAGNILGPEQSGQIAAVGYDLYVQLLKQAVNELKGEKIEEEIDPELKLNIAAYLPQELVPDTSLRLTLYKQLASLSTEEDFRALKDEWIDRFGPLPSPAKNLIHLMRLKVSAKKMMITSLALKQEQLTLQIHPKSPLSTDYFIVRAQKEPKKCKLLPDGKFLMKTKIGTDTENLRRVEMILGEMGKEIS